MGGERGSRRRGVGCGKRVSVPPGRGLGQGDAPLTRIFFNSWLKMGHFWFKFFVLRQKEGAPPKYSTVRADPTALKCLEQPALENYLDSLETSVCEQAGGSDDFECGEW